MHFILRNFIGNEVKNTLYSFFNDHYKETMNLIASCNYSLHYYISTDYYITYQKARTEQSLTLIVLSCHFLSTRFCCFHMFQYIFLNLLFHVQGRLSKGLYFSYFYSIVERVDRIARELDASTELETCQGRVGGGHQGKLIILQLTSLPTKLPRPSRFTRFFFSRA